MAVFDGKMEALTAVKWPMVMWRGEREREREQRKRERLNEDEEEGGPHFNVQS